MKSFKTKATTKKGSFDVTVVVENEIGCITGVSYTSFKALVNIDGKEIEARVETTRKDRIYASLEMCELLGISYDTNIALHCDISEAINYSEEESRKGYRMLAEAEQMHENFFIYS